MTVSRLIATWGGVGLLPKAPGTWGSLAALPFAWVIYQLGGWQALAVAAIAVFILGVWAADRAASETGVADPSEVVIDEVAGQWLTLLVVPPDLLLYAVGFVLFRLTDIFKPWPASWADEKIKGGFGIMLDDVFAAGYAVIMLHLFSRWVETL